MSKHWKPGKNAAVRPSRIRREPVRVSRIRREPVKLESKADLEKAEARARELEIWGGVGGVLFFAAAVVVLVVGVSAATFLYDRPGPVEYKPLFGQCYNSEVVNCVLDGDTAYIKGEKVTIAGLAAPQITTAACPEERTRGIAAAVRLADLLNSGTVTASPLFRDDFGRRVRKVSVNRHDVAETMIDAGLAREYDGTKQDWC